ncbi:MAG: Polysaccharide deacetylase [Anaerolineales bacterium]|nr:Polysaccharide deacetylase [Anaerolineales bacterium]
MFKRVSSLAAQSKAFSTFVALLEQAGGARPNLLGVLTYHRVDEPGAHPALYPGLISATPEVFGQQMDYLATNYHVVSVRELIEVYRTGGVLPPRSVTITFDDACHDFAEYAWPILKRYRLPVTLLPGPGEHVS